jgi:hypothetical protein
MGPPVHRGRRASVALVALAWLACAAAPAGAAAPVGLGGAGGFAVLAGTTVTSAGVSTLTGDLGVSPGTAIPGFGPGTVSGTIHAGDDVAAQAHADLATAYGVAVARSPATPAGVLDGLTLDPGVYASGAALALAGTLTLDAGGDPSAVFILQAGSTLTTTANSHVVLADGAQACNVFWQVGSSAALGATSDLKGSILAMTSISMGDAVSIDGRALARDGAVTMINDTVAVPACAAGSLSNTAPAISPFAATLTGAMQTLHTAVGAWSLTDSRGTGAGYSVTVAATAPTVDGSSAAAGTGASMTLTPRTPTPATGNAATTGPVAAAARQLSTTATTIATAIPGTGNGGWDFPADTGDLRSLELLIPADAGPGAFSSTLTFTTAPAAG